MADGNANVTVKVSGAKPASGSKQAQQQQPQRGRRQARQTNTRARGKSRGRWQNSPGNQPGAKRNRWRKAQMRVRNGNRHVNITCSATLGTVGSNQKAEFSVEMVSPINPVLIKEATGSNAFSNLQINGSMYALYKPQWINVKLTPLVGASAVSGTVARVSYNESSQPNTSSWSGLGSRYHIDVTPGQTKTFKLNQRNFKGPKKGWFECSTKNDPQMCLGGNIEIHTLGKTVSTYTNQPYEGDLFLVELVGRWSFTNWNPQPGLMNLVKTQHTDNVQLQTSAGQPVTLKVNQASALGSVQAGGYGQDGVTVGEIIYTMVDTGVEATTALLAPPFNWLLKGGWWFVKKVIGKADANGQHTFYVYQTMADAQNNKPIVGTASQTATLEGTWDVQQITPDNLGTGNVSGFGATSVGPVLMGNYQVQGYVCSTVGDSPGSYVVPPIYINGTPGSTTELTTAPYIQDTSNGTGQKLRVGNITVIRNLEDNGGTVPTVPTIYQVDQNGFMVPTVLPQEGIPIYYQASGGQPTRVATAVAFNSKEWQFSGSVGTVQRPKCVWLLCRADTDFTYQIGASTIRPLTCQWRLQDPANQSNPGPYLRLDQFSSWSVAPRVYAGNVFIASFVGLLNSTAGVWKIGDATLPAPANYNQDDWPIADGVRLSFFGPGAHKWSPWALAGAFMQFVPLTTTEVISPLVLPDTSTVGFRVLAPPELDLQDAVDGEDDGDEVDSVPREVLHTMTAAGRKIASMLLKHGLDEDKAAAYAQSVEPHSRYTIFLDTMADLMDDGYEEDAAIEIATGAALAVPE